MKPSRNLQPQVRPLRNTAIKAPGRFARARSWIAGVVASAVVVTVAVVAQGFDAQEVPRQESAVWVMRDAGQYARVNTETGEIDTVRKVSDPSGVVQVGARSAVLTNGNGRAWPVDQAMATDFVEQESTAQDPAATPSPAAETANTSETEAVRLPDGTREVLVAGNYLLLRTAAGGVYIGSLSAENTSQNATQDSGMPTQEIASRLQSLQQIDPLAADKAAADKAAAAAKQDKKQAAKSAAAAAKSLKFDAIALSADGQAALYAASAGKIWRFNAARNEFAGGAEQLPRSAVGISEAQLALIADDWVLLETKTGKLWRQGTQPLQLKLSGTAKLQDSHAGGDAAALIADTAGLWRVPAQGKAERIATANGTPAQPRSVKDVTYAAWVGQNGGKLWNSADAKTRELSLDESATKVGDVAPVFYTNGERAVLGEPRTGMLWTIPTGKLIPLAQWTIADPPKSEQGTVAITEVTEQVAPTAVNDIFGVRQGEPAPLPVLLNDFDPNKRDVLTIVPESLAQSPLPSEFGTIEILPDGQSLLVHPSAQASGTATFSYRISDGTLTSNPASVTLNVVPADKNTAPEWCPVAGCQRTWQVPPITPGGTLVYPILEGWVDPDGDPILLTAVELLRPEDPAVAIVTADGRLAVRHTDANAAGSEIMLRLTVHDSKGLAQTRDLQIAVQTGAIAQFQPLATSVRVGDQTVLQPLERVAGGSGSFQLVNATVQSGADNLSAVIDATAEQVKVQASAAGEALLSLDMRDTVTGNEFSGVVRITASTAAPPLTLPPLTAFVRPFADSTVEILHALPDANSRDISVISAKVADGDLRADVIDHAKVRVSGSTADGAPGRIGAVDIIVAAAGVEAKARLTVFQVSESGVPGAVAIADAARVRAGAVVDIPVLDNDVAAPGERLILHPEVTGSGADGELAFASGNVLRYLAPAQPGTYKLTYTTYGTASPEAGDVGTVTVTVLPRGANQDPTPATLFTRVAPGEKTLVEVPLSGVDPDGDRVRLIGVDAAADPKIATSIADNGDAIAVVASDNAAAGVMNVPYTVRDGEGANGKGILRIIVNPASTAMGAPIAASDYVRLVAGSSTAVSVRPLDNDIDPAQGALKIISVVPNLPGGEANPEFARAKDRLNLQKLRQGVIMIKPGENLGMISYRYKVQSTASLSTAEGLLMVQTSQRVAAQAPRITDTVLNVRERSELARGGVDVITDKIHWSAGDPSALQLSLWGKNAAKYRVQKNSITGEYNSAGDLVVFKLSGVDSGGSQVSSFGFLIIPPLDELRVTLKPGIEPLRVAENKSLTANLRSFLDLSANDRVELAQENFSVARQQASCKAVSESDIRYDAGAEEPWADTCLVRVRLVGQKLWTQLPVPITIVPRAPLVQLRALTRTVPPGGTEKIDLLDMVEWLGNRTGDIDKLHFTISGSTSLFEVQHSANAITVAARADAPPGGQETLNVAVSGAGQSLAPLILRIGEAPREQPRGGTVNLTCTVGDKCAIDVVGVAGEYDPFAAKRGGGLKLEAVNSAACTVGVVQRASERGVSVSWPDARGPGGRCTIGFSVRDAQGRIGEGAIELDAQGVPRAPASLALQSFSAESVTFAVDLGAAQSAHPAVSGVEVSGAGSSLCTPAGPAIYQCVVSGLQNGQQHSFVARAINAVGSSDPSGAAVAWAYRAPKPPQIVQLESIPGNGVSPTTGIVQYRLRGADDVAQYAVDLGGQQEIVPGPDSGVRTFVAPVGEQLLTVTAVSKFQPPTGGAVPNAESATQKITVAGAPSAGDVVVAAHGDTNIAVNLAGSGANFAPGGLRYAFTISQGWLSDPAACPTDESAYGTNGTVFNLANRYVSYKIRGCVWNGFGFAGSNVKITSAASAGNQAVPTPGGKLSFLINDEAVVTGGTHGHYGVKSEAAPTPLGGMHLQYRVNGVVSDQITHDENSAAEIFVRQCADIADELSCSAWVSLKAEGSSNAPTVVSAHLIGVCVPVGDAKNVVNISSAAFNSAAVSGTDQGVVTINWTGAFSQLKPLQLQGNPCPTSSNP